MSQQEASPVARLRAAARANAIKPSGTVAVSQKVRDLAAKGITVVNMGGGDPDFATPGHIVEAAIRALQDGATHYADGRGLAELRQAIADKLSSENNIAVSPDTGIIVTPGAKFAVLLSLLAHLSPGDEVLLPDPCWSSYAAMVRLAEGVAVSVPTLASDGFRLNRELLEAAITPRTRVLVICSPCNPTGHVLDEKEIAAVVEVATRHDLLVISDEIYERIVYPETVHRSLAAELELAPRTLTVNGFSKAYAMTGWRLGYVAGPEDLMKELNKVQQHSIYCVAPFIQQAGVAALRGPQNQLGAMVEEYRQRRDAFVDLLNAMPGVQANQPAGTFYVFPSFGDGIPSRKIADRLLEVGGVAATAGVVFGGCAEGRVRFTLRIPVDKLVTVTNGIRRTLEAIAAEGS
jgi:aspartate aminotransferase